MRTSLVIRHFERLSSVLHWLSPSKWLKRLLTRLRGRRELHGFVDVYVLSSALVASSILALASSWPSAVRAAWVAFVAIAGTRILEILSVTFDVLVFDRMRSQMRGREHIVESWERTFFLGLINYVELILYFAIIYFVALPNGR